MGAIFMTGGPASEDLDGPVASAVSQVDFHTCVHCQATIRVKIDLSSIRGCRIDTDHRCLECQGKPICVACGNLQLGGVKCPGPYRLRALAGLT